MVVLAGSPARSLPDHDPFRARAADSASSAEP
jgi:hypothetical protein